MPIAILIIGAILVITAFNNSFPALATALETDIPPYFVWAAAIAAICAIGYIPGLRTPSRYLLALVLLVILLANYTQIYAGFQGFASSGATTTAGTGGTATPTAAYTAANAPAAAATTTASATTPAPSAAATTTLTAAQQIAANPLNPNSYVGLAAGFGGLA
jgi:hypothetical protein